MRPRTPLAALAVAGVSAVAAGGLQLRQAPRVRPSLSSAGASTTTTITGTVTVFAAASLQETFTTLKKQFEEAHPGVTVTPNFGASSALATGSRRASPPTSSPRPARNMDAVVKAGGAASSTTVRQEHREIAVPAANPANIASVTTSPSRV